MEPASQTAAALEAVPTATTALEGSVTVPPQGITVHDPSPSAGVLSTAPPGAAGSSSGLQMETYNPEGGEEDDDDDDGAGDGPPPRKKRGGHGRRKIEIEYIDDKIRRHITFSKRKAGISKKAYELSRLTGAQVRAPT